MADQPVPAAEAEVDAFLAREAEVAALVAQANDPDDPYDSHHGSDRTAR